MGGHTAVVGEAVGRLRGVEFARMGMTNVVGRYPVHFHHSTTGAQVRGGMGGIFQILRGGGWGDFWG